MASVVSSARAALYRRFLDLCQLELREVDSWHLGVGSVLCLYALKWIELECSGGLGSCSPVAQGVRGCPSYFKDARIRTHGTHGTDKIAQSYIDRQDVTLSK